MLDLTLRDVSFRYGSNGFALEGITTTFERSTHTAVIGAAGSGTSTLVRLIAGFLKPTAGDVILGQRRVNELKPAHRPLLHVTSDLAVSQRWSVQHALIAAGRTRKLDRIDRHREFTLAVSKWELEAIVDRKLATLSSTEAARVQLAWIELLRPAVLVADRLLEKVSATARLTLAAQFFRTMRVLGTTVISVPSTRDELSFSNRVMVLDRGRLVQSGSVAELFSRPLDASVVAALGDADLIPITIHGRSVDSAIGAWEVEAPPFQGRGVAMVRPSDFVPAAPGEESDLIFGIEEAGFAGDRWLASGFLSGGTMLRIELPPGAPVHKGRLLALRYDPAHFPLFPILLEPRATSVPVDVVPPLRESR